MYPKDIPDLFAENYKRTSPDNIYIALKKFWPALVGGKKRAIKPGSKIKAENTHEDWYLACEAY